MRVRKTVTHILLELRIQNTSFFLFRNSFLKMRQQLQFSSQLFFQHIIGTHINIYLIKKTTKTNWTQKLTSEIETKSVIHVQAWIGMYKIYASI